MKKSDIYKLIPNSIKIFLYNLGGKKPFSPGYSTYKFRYIKKVLADKNLLKKFETAEKLLEDYGHGLDERAVEYPWALSRLPAQEGALLDACSVLNFKEILDFPKLKNKKIIIANLNPEENCFTQKGISYFFGDIRSLPFLDNFFDCITSLSTLEHVGMDNSIYTPDGRYQEKEVFDFEKAVIELKRVLKPGGRIFITVPFGQYQNFGRFQQFDSKLIKRIIEVFNPQKQSLIFYKYSQGSWNIYKK